MPRSRRTVGTGAAASLILVVALLVRFRDILEQAHIAGLACERWLEADDPVERDRLEAWFREVPDDPVTCARIGRILHALG